MMRHAIIGGQCAICKTVIHTAETPYEAREYRPLRRWLCPVCVLHRRAAQYPLRVVCLSYPVDMADVTWHVVWGEECVSVRYALEREASLYWNARGYLPALRPTTTAPTAWHTFVASLGFDVLLAVSHRDVMDEHLDGWAAVISRVLDLPACTSSIAFHEHPAVTS